MSQPHQKHCTASIQSLPLTQENSFLSLCAQGKDVQVLPLNLLRSPHELFFIVLNTHVAT